MGPVAPVNADLPGVVCLCIGIVTEEKIVPCPLLCFSGESVFAMDLNQ